jgi:hydroxymethylglutaryl-CoA lyase
MNSWPKITFRETVMQEGMQIESVDISVDDKVELLAMLSATGLRHIVVGSFVSSRWTPQMRQIDEIVARIRPVPGVTYSAMILNAKGLDRARRYSPPLSIQADLAPRLYWHLCDIFARRNTNRSQMEEIGATARIVNRARLQGVLEAGIGIGAAWGSNFLGPFTLDTQLEMLSRQRGAWNRAGIRATSCTLSDPMSFCTPHEVARTLTAIKQRWPEIRSFTVHLHNARNMALASIYAAMTALDADDTLHLDGAVGGIGGCPYCGNGQATGTAPTEDLVHMFESMQIDTGIDLNRLIDCVEMVERMVGRRLFGHVSLAGPRPASRESLYDPNMPFIQTMAQAKHFKLGSAAYASGYSPYVEKIASPYRDRLTLGLPAYDPPSGRFPWQQLFLSESELSSDTE